MAKKDIGEVISKKLNVIISLLNDIKYREEKASLKEKIDYLTKFDLSNKDVSEILGKSEKHISKEKSLMKNKNE